jgi:hypothetical protein
LLKQHDILKEESIKEEARAQMFVGIPESFNSHMAKAQQWLNVAKWNLRAIKIYVGHLEDLDVKTPVKVSFT